FNAIEKDSLSWSNVIAEGGFDSTVAKDYFIQAIPNSYLIDGNGHILGANLSPKAIAQIMDSQ
ncbi:MAG: hypothetical protein AAF901_03730, partial [Bacteroidota bacterium]